MKYKVSNVCQLLDKSVIPATQTINGVTFTNNGDGSVTVTGTPTNSYSYFNIIPQGDMPLKVGHVYSYGGASGTTYIELVFKDSGGDHYYKLTKATEGMTFRLGIIRLSYAKADAVTLYPQLFDLTEMYGAGNEPTTVAQFRADFPDEYYEYSPECWKRIRELRYVQETRNLFDISQATPYTFYNDNPPESAMSLKDGLYTTSYNNYNIGSGLRIKDGWTLPAGNYVVSTEVVECTGEEVNNVLGAIGFRYKDSSGKWQVHLRYVQKVYNYIGQRITGIVCPIPEGVQEVRLYLSYQNNYVRSNSNRITFRNIQVEKRDNNASSPYQPYGYLGMRKGKYVAETKNLFDISQVNSAIIIVTGQDHGITRLGDYLTLASSGIESTGSIFFKYPIHLTVGIYTFSFTTGINFVSAKNNAISVMIRKLPSDTSTSIIHGFRITEETKKCSMVFTVSEESDYYFGFMTAAKGTVTGWDIQLEEGSTATSYQPYKHISFN